MLSCEAHVDSGLLTLLHQDDRGGLQVRGADARWHSLAPDADAFVVNTGLALQQMTGGALVATQHRVLYARRRRISIPFFFIKCFTPTASRLDTFRECATTLEQSKRMSVALNPNGSRFRSR